MVTARVIVTERIIIDISKRETVSLYNMLSLHIKGYKTGHSHWLCLKYLKNVQKTVSKNVWEIIKSKLCVITLILEKNIYFQSNEVFIDFLKYGLHNLYL